MVNKILLVDDDENIRLIAQLSLEDDWQVFLASSGMEGVEKARQEKPDLILLDMMMPGMDGPTTFGKLQEYPETATIPIIFLTAKVQTHEIAGYINLGAWGVISKPFDPMTLTNEIQSILNSRKN